MYVATSCKNLRWKTSSFLYLFYCCQIIILLSESFKAGLPYKYNWRITNLNLTWIEKGIEDQEDREFWKYF